VSELLNHRKSLATDDTRAASLARNRSAIGPPTDPTEFRHEYARFERLLPQRRPLRVLDIGCGTGAWAVHWVTHGCKVTGVDIDPEVIARARLREQLANANAFQGVVADATRLPPDIGKFDVVTLNSLLEHVPNWRAAINRAARAVAPGGMLFLHTTNRRHPFQEETSHFPSYPWLPRAIRDRSRRSPIKQRHDLAHHTDAAAVHRFSYPQLSRVLRELGFEVYDRLDLARPEWMTGLRSIARLMVPRFLFYIVSSGVELYARRPDRLDRKPQLGVDFP
jgi:2-polyprenyl-6-hydroxyphenyl methylase/3-demethylubiquinone-9 3-methyltransferase